MVVPDRTHSVRFVSDGGWFGRHVCNVGCASVLVFGVCVGVWLWVEIVRLWSESHSRPNIGLTQLMQFLGHV